MHSEARTTAVSNPVQKSFPVFRTCCKSALVICMSYPLGPLVTTPSPWLLRHNENYASTQQIFRNANTMIWAIGMGTLEGPERVNSLSTKCSDLEGGCGPKTQRETCAQVSCDLEKETAGAWAHGQPTLRIFPAAKSSLCPCQGSLPSSTPTRAGQQSQDAKSKYFLSTAI